MAVQYVCGKCGSKNVISDTRAEWDLSRQHWIVVGHYDSSECLNCESEDSLVEVELVPASHLPSPQTW